MNNVRIDPNGFWDKRNIENGKVIIPSNRITMKGVNFPVLGVSDTGDMKVMLPNGEYKFNGNNVTEYKMEKGGKTTIGNTSFDMMDKFKRTIMSPQYATQVDNSQEQFQSGGQDLKDKMFGSTKRISYRNWIGGKQNIGLSTEGYTTIPRRKDAIYNKEKGIWTTKDNDFNRGNEVIPNGYDNNMKPIYIDRTKTKEHNNLFHDWINNDALKNGNVIGNSYESWSYQNDGSPTTNVKTYRSYDWQTNRDDGTVQYITGYDDGINQYEEIFDSNPKLRQLGLDYTINGQPAPLLAFAEGGDWVNAWNKSQSDMRNRANYLMGYALATMYDQAYNPIISEREYTDWYKNPNYNPLNDKALEQYRKDKDNLQNKYGLDVVYNEENGSFLYRDNDGNEYGDMDDFYNEKYSELSKRDQQIYDLDKSTDTINAATSNLSKMTGMPNLQIGTFMHNKINGIDMPHAKWGRNWEYVGRTYGEETPSGFNPNDYTSVYKKGRITAWSTAPIQQSPVPTEEQKPERERRNPYRPLDGIEGFITSPEQLSDVDWGKRGQYRIQVGKVFFDKLVESQVKKHNRALAQQNRDYLREYNKIYKWNNSGENQPYNPLNPEFQFNQESDEDYKTQYESWLNSKKEYRQRMKDVNEVYRQTWHRNPKDIYSPSAYYNKQIPPKFEFARGGNWKEMQEISLDPNTEYVSRSGTERTIDYGAIADILRSGVRFATGVGYGIDANKYGLTSEQLQAANLFSNNQEVRDPGDIAVNPTGVGTVNPYNQTEIQHYAQYGGRTFEKGGVYHNVTLEELKKLRDGGIKYKII